MKRLGYFKMTKVKKLRECLAAGRLTDLIVPLETYLKTKGDNHAGNNVQP